MNFTQKIFGVSFSLVPWRLQRFTFSRRFCKCFVWLGITWRDKTVGPLIHLCMHAHHDTHYTNSSAIFYFFFAIFFFFLVLFHNFLLFYSLCFEIFWRFLCFDFALVDTNARATEFDSTDISAKYTTMNVRTMFRKPK